MHANNDRSKDAASGQTVDPADAFHRTETRDGMRITWHEPIEMDDGTVLRADVYRPIEDGAYPVIISYGAFGKGVAFQEGYPM